MNRRRMMFKALNSDNKTVSNKNYVVHFTKKLFRVQTRVQLEAFIKLETFYAYFTPKSNQTNNLWKKFDKINYWAFFGIINNQQWKSVDRLNWIKLLLHHLQTRRRRTNEWNILKYFYLNVRNLAQTMLKRWNIWKMVELLFKNSMYEITK